jgi:seryl-tRNA synthetase
MRSPLLNYSVLLGEVNLASVTKLTTSFFVYLKGKITKLADSKQINHALKINSTLHYEQSSFTYIPEQRACES